MSIIVGIGTSAGGLKALEELVQSLPVNSQYTYLVAQHLNKDKKSSLVEILARFSSIPVLEAPLDCKFLTNHIYIIPPNYNLAIKDNKLFLQNVALSEHISTPSIDMFLESIAAYKGNSSLGIILTGSGNDGTLGMTKIHEVGGVTIVQSPEEAEHSSMPLHALENLEVDYVFSLEQIASYLSSSIYMNDSVKQIIKVLNESQNQNIHKYKSETIIRRINKRMLLVHCKTAEEYLKYLNSNPKELKELHQNILIGVTSFFRDKNAFETLRIKLINYLKDKPENYEFRVWSIACSSGEEAYSLSILIAEINKTLNKKIDLRMFATDIDDRALSKARKAYYPKEALCELDQDIIDNYFIEVENGYKLVQSIRQKIVFTHHNILSDPPFINQDLISCRNFLIYILPEVQKEIFTLFNYSLKENSLLFLGSSESAMLGLNHFSTLSSEYKIYKKEKLSTPPKISNHYFSKHLEQTTSNKTIIDSKQNTLSIEEVLKSTIFTFFSPNCIVIDKNYSIIYKKGNLPFLNMPDGFVSLNILENVDESLRYDINILIKNTFESESIQTTKFIEIKLASSEKIFLRVVAYPFNDTNDSSTLLLYFQQLHADDLQFSGENIILPYESFMIKSLSSQLLDTREELHSISDELLIHKENMQLLNEELQSSNEELQSSNEELETSNEELQSSNEELHTSILDTQTLQEQLSLILNSSQDSIIGLDVKGRHTFANSAALNILGYSLDELIGKNGHNLWHHTKADGTHYDQEKCLFHSTLTSTISRRVEDLFYKKDGTAFEVEVLQNPIIKNGVVVGAVLSFHDISEKNRLKKISQHEHQLADLYLNVAGNIVMKLNSSGDIDMINEEGATLLGSTQNEVIGKNWFDNFIPKDIAEEIKTVFSAVMQDKMEMLSHYTNTVINADQKEYLISWTNSIVKDIDGNISGLIASGSDITQETKLSQKLSEQEHLYKLTFEEADIGIAHVSLDGYWIDTNEYLSKLLGYSKSEFKHLSIYEITHKDDTQNDKKMIDELLKGSLNSYHVEKRFIHKNGSVIWISLNVVVLKDRHEKPLYLLKIIRDISEIKMLMYQLDQEKNELNRIVQFTPIPIMLHDVDGKIILVNRAFEQNTGYTLLDVPNMDVWMEKLYKNSDDSSRRELQADYEEVNPKKEIEHSITTQNGEKHIWLLKSSTLNGNMNKKDAFISSSIDITDIKNKDDIMIAQSRQAAMGDMLAMVSHQWRQPLSVISMSANTIKAQQELEEEITPKDLKDFIRTINEQTNYLSTTIDDFRNFFKPDKARENIGLFSIFDKLTTLVEKTLINNSISLEIIKEQNITISTYPNQLLQIMLNLINNAKDAILEKSPINPLIKISYKEINDEVIIEVKDNGGGIDPSIKETISQPYVSTKSKNGTGLGLYMSTVIAKKHLNGRIYWSSNKDGSSFFIALAKLNSTQGDT